MVNFLVTAGVAFVSTALDDFVVQLYFMSKATNIEDETERHTAYMQIVAGTVLSNLTVVLLALLGLVSEVFISTEWIALLGFFPLCTGLWAVYEGAKEMEEEDGTFSRLVGMIDPSQSAHGGDVELLRSHHGSTEKGTGMESGGEGGENGGGNSPNNNTKNPILGEDAKKATKFEALPQGDDEEDDDGVTTVDGGSSSVGGDNESRRSLAVDDDQEDIALDEEEGGGNALVASDGDDGDGDDDDGDDDDCPVDQDEIDGNIFASAAKKLCGQALSPLALEVLVMNLAVSSDNVVIYTTVFVTESISTVFLTVLMIMTLVLITLVLALFTARMKVVSNFFENYSCYLISPLLIGLGCYILSDSVIFHH
jgi:cadmium resistance protein CadD (predicted permease)